MSKDSSSKSTSVHGPLTLWEKILRYFIGHDFFISYSHHDELATTYAPILAGAISKRKRDVHLDQWGTDAKNEIPKELKRILRLSRVLVVIGSDSGYHSLGISQELDLFIPTKGYIVPIDLGGSIGSAHWWSKLDGLQPTRETALPNSGHCPSEAILDRVLNTHTFISARKRRSAGIALATFFLTAALIVVVISSLDVQKARLDAGDAANNQARAESATNSAIAARKDAENATSDAKNDASDARNSEAEANMKASDANNSADEARNSEKLAKEGEGQAKIESARQNRISVAGSEVARILDHENPDPLYNLKAVGKAFSRQLAEGAPVYASQIWLANNLPRTPQILWQTKLKLKPIHSTVSTASRKIALVDRSRLSVVDVVSGKENSYPFPGPDGQPFSNYADYTYLTNDYPNVHAMISPGGTVAVAVQNTLEGNFTFLLKKDKLVLVQSSADPMISSPALDAVRPAVAYSTSKSIEIYDDRLADKRVSVRGVWGSYVGGLPNGGFAFANADDFGTIRFNGTRYVTSHVPLPEPVKGKEIKFFGINPYTDQFEIIGQGADGITVVDIKQNGEVGSWKSLQIASFSILGRHPSGEYQWHIPAPGSRIDSEEGDLPPYYPAITNATKWFELMQIGRTEPLARIQLPGRPMAGWYFDSSKIRRKGVYNLSRPRLVVAWDEVGNIIGSEYRPEPLVYDSGVGENYSNARLSANGKFLIEHDPRTCRLVLSTVAVSPDGLAVNPLKTFEDVGNYVITDRFLVISNSSWYRLNVYEIPSMKRHSINLNVPDLGWKGNEPKSFNVKFSHLSVGNDGCLYGLVQKNGQQKKISVTSWQTQKNLLTVENVDGLTNGYFFAAQNGNMSGLSPTIYSFSRLAFRSGKDKTSFPMGNGLKPIKILYDRVRGLWAVATNKQVQFYDMFGRPRTDLFLTFDASILDIAFANKNPGILAILRDDSRLVFHDIIRNLDVSSLPTQQAEEISIGGSNDEYVLTSSTHGSAKIYSWKPEAMEKAVQKRVKENSRFSQPNLDDE